MQELLKLIKKFEEKSGKKLVDVRIFSDGSGSVNDNDDDNELFSFDTLDDLIQWLEA